MQRELSFTIISSSANGNLREALLPNKEEHIDIDGVIFRPGGRQLNASLGDGEFWVWGISIAKGIASLLVLEAFKKFILPKILNNDRVTALNIGGKRIAKKQEDIEKAFLAEIEKLEKEDEKQPK